MMSNLIIDIRYACRTLRRSPWFTTLAAVTIALSVGATTTLFSLVDAVVLKALPYSASDRLVEIWSQDGGRAGGRVPGVFLDALRERSQSFESIAIHGPAALVLRTPDGSVDYRGHRVSANFLDLLGVPPLLGRGFLAEEERADAPPVVLISFRMWRQQLAGDPTAVGRTLYLSGQPFTVVGVMPPNFTMSFVGGRDDFWTTYVNDRTREFEASSGYELVARLSPGATVDSARGELEALTASVTLEGWGSGRRTLGLNGLKEDIIGDRSSALQMLFATVGVVLLAACANLAQLLLARSDRRIGEFATRKAIGAGSRQLFRQALVESLMVAALGGAGGVVLAVWLLPLVLALAPSEIPRLDQASIDLRVLMMAVGVTALTGCTFGFAPALRLSRLSVVEAMQRQPGRVMSHGVRVRSALVVVQVAVSVTMAALAGLVGQTFLRLLPSSPGFNPASRTVFISSFPPSLFADPLNREAKITELLGRLRTIPGVSDAGLASNVPFSDDDGNSPVRDLDTAAELDARRLPGADVREVSHNLFQLLEMPLLRGRLFSASDGAQAPRVAIVNRSLASKLAADGDVIGRKIRIGASESALVYEIVGVVADARSLGTSLEILNEVYVPFVQSRSTIAYVILHSSLDAAALTPAIRKELHTVFPALPLRVDQAAIAMEDLIGRSFARVRFTATLISAFSSMALLLAAVGLFGLVAYSVSQRRRELGMRAALGAGPRALLVTTMRSAVVLTAAGIVLGVLLATYVTRFVANQLYGIHPLDMSTFAGATTVMLLVAALAAYVPARRALQADPMTVLRSD